MPDELPAPSCHEPVLAAEVLRLLALQPGQTVVDGTLGGGGHARLLAERVGKTGRVLGLDRDGNAIAAAQVHLAETIIEPIHASYANLPEVCEQFDVERFPPCCWTWACPAINWRHRNAASVFAAMERSTCVSIKDVASRLGNCYHA